jgi:thiamine biosynthesis protein ThiI
MHPFSSGDVMRELGTALNPGAVVDLDSPDIEVEVEVRDGDVYFFSGREPALGGLPLGVEGRAVALLSGGFDSAVSAWMMLKRGVQLDYVFCNLAGDAYERSVLRVAKILADDWSYGTRPKLHVIDFGDLLDEIRQKTQPKYWQLVLKRLMYRVANAVARDTRADAIVTGEAIGQVSSQTLSNLAAIDRASDIPVFRPLLGFDKVDIIDLTRRIGSYEISSRVKEYCAIAPGNPATSATAQSTEHEEARVDPEAIERALRSRKIIDLRALQSADLVMGYLFTESLPPGAIVVDLREAAEWEEWHYPGSLNHSCWWIDANPRAFDRDKLYVLYCNQGVQSAQAAESMQRAGFEADAFKGGIAALRRNTEANRT